MNEDIENLVEQAIADAQAAANRVAFERPRIAPVEPDNIRRDFPDEKQRPQMERREVRMRSDPAAGVHSTPNIYMPDGSMPLPFWVRVYKKSAGAYACTVTQGTVCERIPKAGDATIFHRANNLTSPPSDMPEFAIEPGQAVYIVVTTADDGSIQSVSCSVNDDNRPTIHYLPPDPDEESGVSGLYHYKLATVYLDGTNPKLTRFLTGGNIDHWREVPWLANTIQEQDPDRARIYKDYDETAGQAKLRVLEKPYAGEVHVKELGDTIEVRGNSRRGKLVAVKCDDTRETILEWRDGLIITGTEGDDITPLEVEIRVGECFTTDSSP